MENKKNITTNKHIKKEKVIDTNLGDLKLNTYYDASLQKEIINIDGVTLISENKLVVE